MRIAEGSFFDSVPGGGDAYILKNIIHDWPDEKAVQILRNVRSAAGPEATLLLVEMVIPEHDRDFPGKWVALEMLLNLAARERTAAEYRNLLHRAGYRMTRVVQNGFSAQRGGGQSRVVLSAAAASRTVPICGKKGRGQIRRTRPDRAGPSQLGTLRLG